MYLRETHQKRADGSVVTHLQLAESVWNPQKKRSEVRIVSNCGRAEDPQTAERLRQLARSILKKCAPHEIVEQDPQWRLLDSWPFGALYVLEAIWRRLGIPDVISEQLASRKVDFAVERALFMPWWPVGRVPQFQTLLCRTVVARDAALTARMHWSCTISTGAMDLLEAHKGSH
jgi:hypothetical protein